MYSRKIGKPKWLASSIVSATALMWPSAGWMAPDGTAPLNESDPFARSYRIASSDEFILATADRLAGTVTVQLLDADGAIANGLILRDETEFTGFADHTDGYECGFVDAAAVDTNADGLDEVIFLWEGPSFDFLNDQNEVVRVGREVVLTCQAIDPMTLTFGESSSWNLSEIGFPFLRDVDSTWIQRQLQLVPAQLDLDAGQEFLAVWWSDASIQPEFQNQPSYIQLVAFELDETGSLVVLGELKDLTLFGYPPSVHPVDWSARFAACAGQLDQRSFEDEIVITYVDQFPTYVWYDDNPANDADYPYNGTYDWSWRLKARVYHVAGGGDGALSFSSEPDADPVLEVSSHSPNSTSKHKVVGSLQVVAGDFDGDTDDEVAVGWNSAYRESSAIKTQTMRISYLKYSLAEDRLEAMDNAPIDLITQVSGYPIYSMALATGDYYRNSDEPGDYGSPDVDDLFILGPRDGVYTRQGAVSGHRALLSGIHSDPNYYFFNDIANQRFSRIGAITDVDSQADDTLEPEIVFSWGYHNGLVGLSVVNENLVFGDEHYWTRSGEGYIEDHSGAMITGDFDGDSLQLGTPRVFHITDFVQPLVIVNAPPIHYDVIDGEEIDLNRFFPDPDPGYESNAVYTRIDEESVLFKTEVSAGWTLSAGLSAEIGGSVGGVKGKVKTQLDAKYGENFSRMNKSTSSYSEEQVISATQFDWIFATIYSYEVLQYPVTKGGESVGSVISVVPTGGEKATFSSRSSHASHYISYHEPGNILSYRSITDTPDFPAMQDGTYFSKGKFLMEGERPGSINLKFSESSELSTTNAVEQSLSARAEVSVSVETGKPILKELTGSVSMSFGAYLQGDIESSRVRTHQTEISSSQEIAVNFGRIGAKYPGMEYDIKPYVYWANNGALVLDYMTDPVPPSVFPTWWELTYGYAPDFSFTFTNRHGIRKGYPIYPVQEQWTNNIQVNPSRPKGGDTVDLFARVHNYSLQAGPSPETVLRFYLGDPDNGGVLLVNSEGESDVVIPPIQPRNYRIVALQDWVVPVNIDSKALLYAVIDPDGAIGEIHEDNNKGWAPLEATGSSLWPVGNRVSSRPTWVDCWMGWLVEEQMPWVYHLQLNYLYMADFCEPDSLFFWDSTLDAWCWTSPQVWPNLYFYSKMPGWAYFFTTTQFPERWWYVYSTDTYIAEDTMP